MPRNQSAVNNITCMNVNPSLHVAHNQKNDTTERLHVESKWAETEDNVLLVRYHKRNSLFICLFKGQKGTRTQVGQFSSMQC